MMDRTRSPQHRTDHLVLSAFDGELLIQDTKDHKAHALNAQAATVFRLADGTRSVEELAMLVSAELQQTMTPEMVWYSLGLLQRKGLLAERIMGAEDRITRKVLQRAGAAVALASIASIVVPAVSAHASGRAKGSGPCSLNHPCCPGYLCEPTPTGAFGVCE